MIREQKNLQHACCNRSCHENYYPYFYSNIQCQHLFDEVRKNFNITDLPSLDSFGDPEAAGKYQEDDWTERLQKCLKLKGIETELTAQYRNHAV